MHIKSLKVFCDIVARRSFSKAADANGISQSGASQIVQQLEDSLSVKLIDRSKRPFVLTPEGAVYYEGCRKIVQRFFALEEEVRTLHHEVAGRVQVASIYSIGLSHLSHCVKDFLAQNPKANVRIEYQHPNRVYELVENDSVELGLVSYPKSSRTIKATLWRSEPMVVVCAPEHPFASRHRLEVSALHGQELIGFDENLNIRREIDRVLTQHAVEPRVAMEFDNIETIKRAVEINAGVSLLPAPSIDRELALGTLVAIPLSNVDLRRPIGLLVRRGKTLGKTCRRFIHLLLSEPADGRDVSRDDGDWHPAFSADSLNDLHDADSDLTTAHGRFVSGSSAADAESGTSPADSKREASPAEASDSLATRLSR